MGAADRGSGARRRRHGRAAVAAAVLTLMAVGAWAHLRWSNSTTPLAVDDVAAGFQSSTSQRVSTTPPVVSATTVWAGASTSPSTTPVTVPAIAPGVYRYETTGQEGIDALSKPVRAYPSETAVVVTQSGCGVRVEWLPLAERREWFEICPEQGGWRLVQYGSFHTFFGTDDERSVICPDDAWLVAPGAPPGTSNTVTCTGSGLVDVRTSTLRGREVVTVDATPVEAVVIDVAVLTSGATTGTSTRELWLAANGLPLAWSDVVAGASESVVGVVNYDERFTLRLASLRPA